ncbi:MAG: antirestriction protein ArdA [Paracoccaceae bacterium]
MKTILYAQPYDIEAIGFYFENAEDYAAKAVADLNGSGSLVEEYEIQFIDGEAIDATLVKTAGLHQGDILTFFEKIEKWDETDKEIIVIAIGECGYDFNWQNSEPGEFEIDIYEMQSLRDLAEHFVDEGLFGEIPEHLQCYIDLDAIARDMRMDYSEIEVAATRLT